DSGVVVVYEAQVQHQGRPDAPVVLEEQAEVMAVPGVAVGSENVHHAAGNSAEEIGLIGVTDAHVLNVEPARIARRVDTADLDRVRADRPGELLFQAPYRPVIVDELGRTAGVEYTGDGDGGEEPAAGSLRRDAG